MYGRVKVGHPPREPRFHLKLILVKSQKLVAYLWRPNRRSFDSLRSLRMTDL
jgi:hypothetical protein